jgi:hypothetical protein
VGGQPVFEQRRRRCLVRRDTHLREPTIRRSRGPRRSCRVRRPRRAWGVRRWRERRRSGLPDPDRRQVHDRLGP